MPVGRSSRRASAESSSTEPVPLIPKEPALHDARDPAAHGPEATRPRVRERTPDPLAADLALARDGDEEAFVRVWRALHPGLLRYLRVRGDDSPEDLASETWMQVLRYLDSFVGEATEFRAWLFTIARHRAVDAGRARARRPSVPVADVTELRQPETAPSAEEQVMTDDATSRALRLVATLPPAQAEMVMLRVVAGLDVKDVAELLGKKPGTVRVAVHRALQTLALDARAHHDHADLREPREVV
jgi:RNA polymerase sigma-70 factor (ECF subfamily)